MWGSKPDFLLSLFLIFFSKIKAFVLIKSFYKKRVYSKHAALNEEVFAKSAKMDFQFH